MKGLITTYLPFFYTITVIFSLFCFFHADSISFIMGGDEYKSAIIPVSIMAFYPIHQTWGQLCGSVFYATENTKIHRNIGIVSMLVGIITTYIFLAPRENYGFQLASTGLALKMVITQIIQVNIQIWYVVKLINYSFFKLFIHQFIPIIFIGLLSFISKAIAEIFYNDFIFLPIFSGILYLIFIFLLFLLFPTIFSITREEIIYQIKKLNNS